MNGIEYFKFEEDFIEENVRCIPMIVRFKMDLAGIKLKLAEWSKFNINERKALALKPCSRDNGVREYKSYLMDLVKKYSGNEAAEMTVDKNPAWDNEDVIPTIFDEKAKEFDWQISIEKWKSLTQLQRFALLKLCRPGHENKNFPKAMKEFKII